MENKTEIKKFLPKVGEHLFLHQRTGNYYVDICKNPYTVIAVTKGAVTIQEAKLIFYGDIYYDSLPDEIVEDREGEILTLHWGRKRGKWQIDQFQTGYPSFAEFGEYQYQPYLD